MSSKFQLNVNTKLCFRAEVYCKNEMKFISLILWSPLMTDDFKALVLQTGKGNPKCPEVFVRRKSNQYYHGSEAFSPRWKSDNNRLRTDIYWLCGNRGNFETDISKNTVLRIHHAILKGKSITVFNYAPSHRSVRGMEV
jgi:hypothetical protein